MPPLLTYNQHIKDPASQPHPRQKHHVALQSINYMGGGNFTINIPPVHPLPPPPPLSVVRHDEPAYSSAAIPVPGATDFAHSTVLTSVPIVVPTAGIPAAAAVAHAERSPTSSINLRPGMRVISRRSIYNRQSWYPGVVYSAKVDPNKLAHAGGGGMVPLIYHIQFDDGTEDPNVPETEVVCDTDYESAVLMTEPLRDRPWEEPGTACMQGNANRRDGRQGQQQIAGQLDLLFTASQIMATSVDGKNVTKKRAAGVMSDC